MGFLKFTEDDRVVSDAITLFALGVSTLITLVLFRSLEQEGDAMRYVNYAKNGGMAFIPKKLLWDTIIALFNKGIPSMLDCDMICAAQLHNIAWAIVAVECVYILVKHLTTSSLAALFAALFTLASNGFWTLATQAEVYIPVLGSFSLLSAILIVRKNGPLSFNRILALSAALLAAILYQQSSVLFVVPIGFYLISTFRRDGIWQFLSLLSIVGIISLCIYLLIFVIKYDEATFATFKNWTLSGANNPDWGTFDNYSVKGLHTVAKSQIHNIIRVPPFISVLTKPVRVVVATALLIIFLWNVQRLWSRRVQWNVRGFFLIWWAMYTLFLLWWLPPYARLILPSIVPIVLLASLTIRDFLLICWPGGRGRHSLVLVGGLLFVIFSTSNFFSSVFPLHSSKGSSYSEAEKLSRLVPPMCQIYTRFRDALNLEYYFDRESLWIRAKLHNFYHSKELALLKRIPHGNVCTAIPLKFLSPDHKIGERLLPRIDGYKRPERYLAFIEWLFNVEDEHSAGLVSHSSFEVITDEVDNSYIIIEHNSRRHSRGVLGLLNELDRRIGESRRAPYGVFRAWHTAIFNEQAF